MLIPKTHAKLRKKNRIEMLKKVFFAVTVFVCIFASDFYESKSQRVKESKGY